MSDVWAKIYADLEAEGSAPTSQSVGRDTELGQLYRENELATIREEARTSKSGNTARAFKGGLYGAIGSGIKGVGANLGSQAVEDYADEFSASAEGALAGSTDPGKLSEIDSIGGALGYARRAAVSGIGSSLPTLAAGVGGTLVGGPGVGVGAALAVGTAQGTGGNIEAQEDESGGERDLMSANLLGVAQGATDLIGGIAGRGIRAVAREATEGAVKQGLGKRIVGTAREEAAQEFVQQSLEEQSRTAVNPEFTIFNKASGERILESTVQGALAGGAAGGFIPNPSTRTPVDPGQPTNLIQPGPAGISADAAVTPLNISTEDQRAAEGAQPDVSSMGQRLLASPTPEESVIYADNKMRAPQDPLATDPMELFTGASTPESVRPISEGKLIQRIRGDLPLDKTVRKIVDEVLPRVASSAPRTKKMQKLSREQLIDEAYERLDSLSEKLAASPDIAPEKQAAYSAAVTRAIGVVDGYARALQARVAPAAPVEQQSATPDVMNASLPSGEGAQLGRAFVGANAAQAQAQQAQAQQVQAEQAAVAQEQAVARAEAESKVGQTLDGMAEEIPAQLDPGQLSMTREAILAEIQSNPSLDGKRLPTFIQRLKTAKVFGDDPLPTPQEMRKLAKTVRSEGKAAGITAPTSTLPAGFAEVQPAPADMFEEPTRVDPKRLSKSQREKLDRVARIRALTPADDTVALQGLLKDVTQKFETLAETLGDRFGAEFDRLIDNIGNMSKLNVGERIAQVRKVNDALASIERMANNAPMTQAELPLPRSIKDRAPKDPTPAPQPAPDPAPVAPSTETQLDLFDTKGKPTKAAQGATNAQVNERIDDLVAMPTKGNADMLVKQMHLRRLQNIVGKPGVTNRDLQSVITSVVEPATTAAQAKELVDTAIELQRMAAPAPALAPATTETPAAQDQDTDAESAVLDEEFAGVNVENERLAPNRAAFGRRANPRLEQADRWVNEITAGWTNLPDEVFVFDPAAPRNEAEQFVANRYNQAVERTGRAPYRAVYMSMGDGRRIVAIPVEFATDKDTTSGLVFHELATHYGLEQAFRGELDNLLRQIYNGNPRVRAQAQALRANSGNAHGKNNPVVYYTEEVLAEAAEAEGSFANVRKSAYESIRDWLVQMARRMGLTKRFTDSEVRAVLQAAHAKVMTGTAGPTTPRGIRLAPNNAPTTNGRQPVGQKFFDTIQNSTALRTYMLEKGVPTYVVRTAVTARDFMQSSRLISMMGNTFTDYANKLGLTDYARLATIQQQQRAVINSKRRQIEDLMIEANQLGRDTQRKALEEFMSKYTYGAKHGFVPEFYSDADKADVVVDPKAKELVDKFRAANPEGYKTMLKLMEYAYKERQEFQTAVRNFINGEADGDLKAAGLSKKEVADIQARRSRQLKLFDKAVPKLDGPYFPLGRFGNFMMVAKSGELVALEAKEQRTAADNNRLAELQADPAHHVVMFSDTMGEAEMLKAQFEADPNFKTDGSRVTAAIRTDTFAQMGEPPLLQMQKLREMMKAELPDTKIDKGAQKQIDNLLRDLYVRALADTSARKYDRRRKNVSGASPEMLRAFHDKMKADAAALGHVSTYNQEMAVRKTLFDQVNKAPTDPQYEERRRFLREMLARETQMMSLDASPTAELQNRVMLASSAYHLLTMPRYYIQNLMQPAVYTAPLLAARHGMVDSARAMTAVVTAISPQILSRDFFSGKIDFSRLNLKPDELAFLMEAQAQGKLEFGQQLDFGEWNSSTSVGRGVLWFIHKARTLSGQVEFVNRTAAGLAAYRLERDTKRTGKQDPTEYALRMIDKTQLNYSTEAQPRLFNMLPRVVTQFRKYQVGMLALQYGLMKNAAGEVRRSGLSAPESREALKALAYSWTTIGAVAGAMGLPGMQLAAVMGAYMFGEDDEPLDGQRWLRGQFSDDEMGLALRKGLPALIGMDMGNVGLGSILNPLPFFDYSQLDETGKPLEMIGAAAGPAAGGAANIISKTLSEGFMAGAEQALPSGFRAMLKSYQMATSGLDRKNGDIIMTPDEIGTMTAALQALGFRDISAAEKMTRYYEGVAAEEYYRGRVSELKRAFVGAQESNDTNTMQDVLAQWKAMNEAKERFDLKPSPVSSLYKAKRERDERVKKFRERAGIIMQETPRANATPPVVEVPQEAALFLTNNDSSNLDFDNLTAVMEGMRDANYVSQSGRESTNVEDRTKGMRFGESMAMMFDGGFSPEWYTYRDHIVQANKDITSNPALLAKFNQNPKYWNARIHHEALVRAGLPPPKLIENPDRMLPGPRDVKPNPVPGLALRPTDIE